MKLANQQDMYIYACWRLVGVAILNVFYSKKKLFLGGDQKVAMQWWTVEIMAFFPESAIIQGLVQPKDK